MIKKSIKPLDFVPIKTLHRRYLEEGHQIATHMWHSRAYEYSNIYSSRDQWIRTLYDQIISIERNYQLRFTKLTCSYGVFSGVLIDLPGFAYNFSSEISNDGNFPYMGSLMGRYQVYVNTTLASDIIYLGDDDFPRQASIIIDDIE